MDVQQQQQYAFESNARKVASALWPDANVNGPVKVDGQERDGIYETNDIFYVLEATVSNKKAKTEYDAKKSIDLVRQIKKIKPEKFFKIFLITSVDPTSDQSEVVRDLQKKSHIKIEIMSLRKFSESIIDSRKYFSCRDNYKFGSIQDPDSSRSKTVDPSEYVPLDLIDSASDVSVSVDEFIQELITDGGIYALTGEFGTGKSMTLRYVYQKLSAEFLRTGVGNFPVYVNLSDHFGQSDPSEVLIRHANLLGFEPASSLVAAWRAGFIDLILDGFDEVSSARLVRGANRLKMARRNAVEVVKRFIDQTSDNGCLIVSGRSNYFDNDNEMKSALGLVSETKMFRIGEFSDHQIEQLFAKKNTKIEIPSWFPTRPLLLGYLAGKGFFSSQGESEFQQYSMEAGWHYLIDKICEREARQIDETLIDPKSVRDFLERLATKARSTSSGRGPLHVRDIDDIYLSIFGMRPDEKAEIFILRLPGFTAASEFEDSREFLDDDFVDACRAGDVSKFVQSPFNSDLNLGEVSCSLGSIGTKVLGYQLDKMGLSEGQCSSAIEIASDKINPYLAFDIVNAISMLQFKYRDNSITIRDIKCEEYDVNRVCVKDVRFKDCYFERIYIDIEDGIDGLPEFQECYISEIHGISTSEEIQKIKIFKKCQIESIVDEAKTNSDINNMNLQDSKKAMITILRKLYIQKGAGRKESALMRGLNAKVRRFVRPVLGVLSSYDLVVSYKPKNGEVWLPNRSKSKFVRGIIENPIQCSGDMIRDIELLK